MTDATALRLADHPRATRQIRRAKAWGGLAALVLTLVLSLRAGLPADRALERALPAAIAGYVVLWAAAVMVWRQLAQAEIERVRRSLLDAMHDAEEGAGA